MTHIPHASMEYMLRTRCTMLILHVWTDDIFRHEALHTYHLLWQYYMSVAKSVVIKQVRFLSRQNDTGLLVFPAPPGCHLPTIKYQKTLPMPLDIRGLNAEGT